jgi:hypothetical protein
VEDSSFPYRRHVDLDAFFPSVEGAPDWEDPEAGRGERSFQFAAACNRTLLGPSGLPVGIETLVRHLLDLGEFDDTDQRDAALREISEILDSYHVAVEADSDGAVVLRNARGDRRQELIDAELHTAFGEALHESDLRVARVHYGNAQRLLRAEDFPNAAKEAVCAVEACLSTLTGERDLKKALRRATDAGLPKPLDGIVEKLYAWRGNEPGIAHGGDEVPAVTRADAQFALNMAAAINLYLRQRLLTDDDPRD